jgi:hypothetical protein
MHNWTSQLKTAKHYMSTTLPIFIPPIGPQPPSSIIWGLYNRPEVATVPSGLVCMYVCMYVQCMYVCMYKGWAFTALAPRPTVVYCA